MTFRYSATNLITAARILSVTSEDPTYLKENLVNQRPSYPFRFTANTGNQILIDLGSALPVTLAGVFNHNLLAPTKFKVKAAAANPPGGGNWDAPDFTANMPFLTGLNNSYLMLEQTYRYWLFDFDDATNPFSNEIGELVLTTHSNFGPGFRVIAESDGIITRVTANITDYGQPHHTKLSVQKKWNLDIFKTSVKGSFDAIETFITDLGGSAGRFIMIEDDRFDQCYYVFLEGSEFTGVQEFFNQEDRRTWSLPIMEFPRGIVLF